MSYPPEHTAHAFTSHPDPDRMFAIAESQAGYFTTSQAETAGYSRSLLAHHASSGTFERVSHGVYRLRRFPGSPREDLFVAWLKAGPRAVVSHESALELYGLSDALPAQTHLTMPRSSSRRRTGIRMHTTALVSDDVTTRDGLPVTTVARTIADTARSGADLWLVAQAVREALDRGLVTRTELIEQATRLGGRARRTITSSLEGTDPT